MPFAPSSNRPFRKERTTANLVSPTGMASNPPTVQLLVAHVLVLAACVEAQRQPVKRRKAVEDGTGRFRRNLRGDRCSVYRSAQQACIGLREDRLQSAEAAELMAYAGGEKLQRARSKRLLCAVVGIDLTEGLRGCRPAHRNAHIGSGESSFEHQLLGVRALEGGRKRRRLPSA